MTHPRACTLTPALAFPSKRMNLVNTAESSSLISGQIIYLLDLLWHADFNYCKLIWDFYRIENKNNNMNENIDLTEILKDCPKGFKLYSPICGSCEFDGFNSLYKNVVRVTHKDGSFYTFTKEGYMYDGYDDAECLLFPSKDQQDWSKFTAPWYKKERFDPKTLQPFDKVLVRDYFHETWRCDFFSHRYNYNGDYPYITIVKGYTYCIPYNDDTKHLVGTTDEAPEYYRYW